jgi:hypothetical protein
MISQIQQATRLLNSCLLGANVFVLGTFEKGVTIYRQQTRALNLAWALTTKLPGSALNDVAIIGGGFAGITLAAALAKKGIPKVTVFEKRAVLFPLQEGSDTRWIHPHIYDWPRSGSEGPSAYLPIMNWNAGRASDVVAHISREWERLKEETAKSEGNASSITEIRGAKYVQLGRRRTVTWASDPVTHSDLSKVDHVAGSRPFTCVVLALGFGEERTSPGTTSYWRNESIGQPELSPQVRDFLISGYGDGALIDLFRIRIRQFRQDRILDELFSQMDSLKEALRRLKTQKAQLDVEFPKLFNGSHGSDKEKLITKIRERLRSDTTALLHVRSGSLVEAYRYPGSSFQNRLLLYLLFEAGGFTPTHQNAKAQVNEHKISPRDILLRHGARKLRNIHDVLSPDVWRSSQERLRRMERRSTQGGKVLWTGGYWNEVHERYRAAGNNKRTEWRKEYLPSATEIVAAAFCSAVAGLIAKESQGSPFRVTLHRTIAPAGTPLLQQACEYYGSRPRKGDKARTFRLNEGIIGLAYNRRLICRTRSQRYSIADLVRDVNLLNVGKKTAQRMAPKVRSLLAIPVLARNQVCMVLFADSEKHGLFGDDLLCRLLSVLTSFVEFALRHESPGIRSFPITISRRGPAAFKLLKLRTIETLGRRSWSPPEAKDSFVLNFEATPQ